MIIEESEKFMLQVVKSDLICEFHEMLNVTEDIRGPLNMIVFPQYVGSVQLQLYIYCGLTSLQTDVQPKIKISISTYKIGINGLVMINTVQI